MATIEEQIKEIEEEIKKTQYNKATQHHIGKLKAKLARFRDELDKRRAQRSAGGGKGYSGCGQASEPVRARPWRSEDGRDRGCRRPSPGKYPGRRDSRPQ